MAQVKKSIVTLILSSLWLLGCQSGDQGVALKTLKGVSYQLDTLVQDYIVINYWAEWCSPCLKEIQELNQLSQADERVLVLGVHFDGPNEQILASLAQQFSIDYPLLMNDPKEQLNLVIEQLPTTFVLNRDGKVLHELKGPQTEKALRKMIFG